MFIYLLCHVLEYSIEARPAYLPSISKQRITSLVKGFTLAFACFARPSFVDVATVHFGGSMHRCWRLDEKFHVKLICINHELWPMVANEILRTALVEHVRENVEKAWRKSKETKVIC
jgi:hypothetical protein